MKAASFPKRRFFYVILVLVLVVAGGLSWYLRRAATNIQNVILISIDTCRADHLSCYGFERQTTPHIDEIAGQGIIYKKARTPVPLTLPAHCSMLTGTFPPYHRVHDNINTKLDESQVTLAEILQENGFATGAVVSSIVLQNKFGVGQGFKVFQDQFDTVTDSYSLVERQGGQASQLAGDFLTRHQNEPFFLFLHYFDPHDAYEPPEPFASRYADDLYSGEIAYTDHCIGQVIDQLKDLELYDSTLIIIVGDHGEALGEHGETTHGYYIYQSTIHVPFIIRAPGIDQPKEVEQTVSLVDVAPTILGYLDIPAPAHMQGEDLSAYSRKRNQVDSDREVYTESLIPTKFGCNPFLGVVNDRWSYIYTNHTELYDLQQDPQ
ncbi:sulfatase, partial [Planctomycetota bacterium]